MKADQSEGSSDTSGEIPRIVPPWSDKGWYGHESRRRMDPEIKALILEAGRGRINPIGYFEGPAALAWSPATHNPYIGIPLGLMFTAVGGFLYSQLSNVLWGAILVGGFFVVLGTLAVVMNIRRVPSWHRARRMVREHVAQTGKKFPNVLRWYT